MAYQRIDLDLADRIALLVANKTMRNLGWHDEPELTVNSVALTTNLSWGVIYKVSFPHWADPQRVDIVEVGLGCRHYSRWKTGIIRVYGWQQNVFEWADPSPFRDQNFQIIWSEKGVPSVLLGTFCDMTVPQDHPSLEEIQTLVYGFFGYDHVDENVKSHCGQCRSCAGILQTERDRIARNEVNRVHIHGEP